MLLSQASALRLRPRVMAALGERTTAAEPALGELVADFGGFLGEVAGVVYRAGREIAALVRERVALATADAS